MPVSSIMGIFSSITDIASNIGNVITAIAAVVVAIFGGLAYIKGLDEYKEQNKVKRAEHFIDLRNRFKGNASFNRIRELLLNNDSRIKDISFKAKTDFLGFYEEIALMVNSDIIRKEVAYYMFGYYAIKCLDCKFFWKSHDNPNAPTKNAKYWYVFMNFAEEMKTMGENFKLNMDDFKI